MIIQIPMQIERDDGQANRGQTLWRILLAVPTTE